MGEASTSSFMGGYPGDGNLTLHEQPVPGLHRHTRTPDTRHAAVTPAQS